MAVSDEPPRRILLSIWWAFFWRFVLATLGAAVVLGIVGGVIHSFFPGAHRVVREGLFILINVASVPCSMWALWQVPKLRFEGFAIEIVPRSL
jgi:uncharacterized membrane protein YraQ (UPF0718 family)